MQLKYLIVVEVFVAVGVIAPHSLRSTGNNLIWEGCLQDREGEQLLA